MHKYCGGGGGGGGVYIHVCLCLVLMLYGAYKNVEVCGGTLCMCMCTKCGGPYWCWCVCMHTCVHECVCMHVCTC